MQDKMKAGSELSDQLGHAAKIQMNRWSHPEWNGSLIAELAFTREQVIEDYLTDCDATDHSLLTFEVVEMTQEQVDALPEFEGF